MTATIETTTQTPEIPSTFAHYNLNDVDPEAGKRKFDAIETDEYTLEINGMTQKTITPKTGKRAGVETEVVEGSFTVVDNAQYGGRKLWHTFWPGTASVGQLQRLSRMTGLPQEPGQTIYEWLQRFGELNPPAKFKVTVAKKAPYNNPDGDPVNEINFFTAKVAE